MSEQRRYYVHLPHGVKLELQLQVGSLLFDFIVIHNGVQYEVQCYVDLYHVAHLCRLGFAIWIGSSYLLVHVS